MENSNFIIKLNRVDIVTLSSVITSCLSVGAALNGYLYLGTALLYLAMLADAMDGILARKYGLERDFGRYLDGFMDVLIYLVSPSIIFYLSGFDGLYSVLLMLLIAFGCIRLSVFNEVGNIKESDGLSYLGMPVFWSVFILGIYVLLKPVTPEPVLHSLLAVTLGAFSIAMVVNRPFFKFKSLNQILSLTIGGTILFSIIEMAV